MRSSFTLSLAFLIFGTVAVAQPPMPESDPVAATVNGDKIMLSEVDAVL